MNLRNAFSKRERSVLKTSSELVTQQQGKEDADINNITERFLKTGATGNRQSNRQPQFGDFTATNFQDMVNTVADVDLEFSKLPARTRARFKNSPYQLLRFLDDPANLPEAIKLGLVEVETPPKSETPPAPPQAPPVATPPVAPPTGGLPKGDQ